MSSLTEPETEYKLFVGNMPRDVTLAEVESVFSPYGQVIEIHMMDGARSRSGQSSAFVKFDNMESCTKAIMGLHMRGKVHPEDTDMLAVKFAKASGSPVRSSSADPTSSGSIIGIPANVPGLLTFKNMVSDSCGSTTAASSPSITPLPSPSSSSGNGGAANTVKGLSKLFVGGLPSYVDRDDLIAIFCPYGKVESVHLMNNNKSKSGQSCAFINFYSKEASRTAIDALNGTYRIEELGSISVRFADNTEDDTGRVVKRAKLSASEEA